MRFLAEITKVEARKTASLDKLIKITIETDNAEALELQNYIASEPVELQIAPPGVTKYTMYNSSGKKLGELDKFGNEIEVKEVE